MRTAFTSQLPEWSVAVFAHNVSRTIIDCLDTIRSQVTDKSLQIVVLINGSNDATEVLVREYAASHQGIVPVSLTLADKANAWNYYIHSIDHKAAVHFFVDGDMQVLPHSFKALARALSASSEANAVGALPAAGRTQAAWSRRMVALGRLAGCLYALKGDFVSELSKREIYIPRGLIGEDLFLSCIVKEQLSVQGLMRPNGKLIFAPDAGFAFRPLSPSRPRDWWTYARRLVRYQVRDYQLATLLQYLQAHPLVDIPNDMADFYCQMGILPRYRWRGKMTPIDVLAVWQLRREISARLLKGRNE
jgi:glycosyltransferase involved in cell wall biosynthesis